MPKVPCYNCEKRFLGCHGSCEDYKKYIAEKEEVNKKKREVLGIDHFLAETQIRIKDKMAKQKQNIKSRRIKRK